MKPYIVSFNSNQQGSNKGLVATLTEVKTQSFHKFHEALEFYWECKAPINLSYKNRIIPVEPIEEPEEIYSDQLTCVE